MTRPSGAAGAAVTLVLLPMLAGCPGPPPDRTADLGKGELFDAGRAGHDTIRRTMECLQKDSAGDCVAVKCTASPGGPADDCNSYAKACIDAGLHWSGTNQGGTCAEIL